MDEEEQKTCPNCKREIPAVNYTIHTVHCARNICVCPVCKEPVPNSELKEHHDILHEPKPCKQCGESVCGTDLEDHIRDSCGHTVKACRYCTLELPRRSLPAHEGYCGARTEQCAVCREYVMIKYRQLHEDSNHGFLRLDDDPTPVPKKQPSRSSNILKPSNIQSTSNGVNHINGLLKNINLTQAPPRTQIRYFERPSGSGQAAPSGSQNNATDNVAVKRSNEQAQVNMDAVVNRIDNVVGEVPVVRGDVPGERRGAVKKRPAPKPPRRSPDPARELAYQRAADRHLQEQQRRDEVNARNLAAGLPPVLSPAQKLEKLRKMDALQNPVANNDDYKNKLQGRVWSAPPAPPAGHVLGGAPLRDLKPMTNEEFMDRFKRLQNEGGEQPADRFSDIKSSLRELRRGLNEVTAPYNSNANEVRRRPKSKSPTNDNVKLPCEFCGTLVSATKLVLHQTGCRPDLARLRSQPPVPSDPYEDPVIPCEFCTESLPVYLVTEHQEKCRRRANRVFPD